MKRILMILFVILIVLPAALIGGCYGAIRFQYRETFMPGLFVNGVYAADMTPQQMNDKLKENALLPTCIITDAEGEEHSFSMEEAGFREDYLAELQNLHETQSVLKFVNWFLENGNVSYQEKQLLPDVSYDLLPLFSDCWEADVFYCRQWESKARKNIVGVACTYSF